MMTIYGRKIGKEDMDIIATYMNDEIREEIHAEHAPCTPDEFIAAYLEEDPEFIDLLKREFDFDGDTWYIVDDCTTDSGIIDVDRINVKTKEEAIIIARNRFGRLSDYDKNRRDSYYVGLADCTKENDVDFYDSMTEIADIKKMGL